jgi:hypothetical protein
MNWLKQIEIVVDCIRVMLQAKNSSNKKTFRYTVPKG